MRRRTPILEFLNFISIPETRLQNSQSAPAIVLGIIFLIDFVIGKRALTLTNTGKRSGQGAGVGVGIMRSVGVFNNFKRYLVHITNFPSHAF